ncbi:MAG TPA: hypothetical protein VGH42_05095 [Verrucomicrobiae bacterium]
MKTDVLTTAKLRLADMEKNEREAVESNEHLELKRIAFNFNRRDYGRLRQLIDVLNGL